MVWTLFINVHKIPAVMKMPNIESDMTVLIIIINNRYACIPTIHGPAWPTRDIPTCIR
jgi:hypothetical protein